jgi:hypothetical protein
MLLYEIMELHESQNGKEQWKLGSRIKGLHWPLLLKVRFPTLSVLLQGAVGGICLRVFGQIMTCCPSHSLFILRSMIAQPLAIIYTNCAVRRAQESLLETDLLILLR